MVRGNMLGLVMMVAVSPIALIGGFLLKLKDPITMSAVGCGLVIVDLIFRARFRSTSGWLFQREFGGALFFLPVWILGLVVIAINLSRLT
ncbi:MAG: hypothetical protein ACKO7R_00885 [Pseudanabaena sp.]